jgi:hypothetical protein
MAAIRVFISRAGRPEGKEADKEIIEAFEQASHEALKRLSDELSFIGWIDFRPATQNESARSGGPFGTGPFFRFKGRREPWPPPDELSEQLTPVMTRLGAADLATVDTLIAAGIASSRAEVLRWAVGAARLGGIEGGLGAAKVPACATFPSSVPLLVTVNGWPAHGCGTLLDRMGRVPHP